MMPARWQWAYFGTREIGAARAWARAGGIAVHENLFGSRGRRAAHLLAPDEARLVAAAGYLGCDAAWIQRTRTVHFDLVGPHLRRALALCGLDPAMNPPGGPGPPGVVCAGPGAARPLGGCRDSPMQLLLESQRHYRGGGGALISAALHAALLGSIVSAYRAEPPRPGLREQFVAYLVPPDRPLARTGLPKSLAWVPEPAGAAVGAAGPAVTPPSIPEAGMPAQDTLTAAGDSGAAVAGDPVFSELEVDSTVRRYPESAAPEYPAALLAANIEGMALVSYVVDSTGVADTATFRVLEASHPAFAAAVQRALARMRFRPALLGGHAVPQLVQQPFSFKIRSPDSTKPPPPPPPPRQR